MVHFAIKPMTFAAAAAFVLILTAQDTKARGAYDGSWTIEVSGNSGNCDGQSYQYNLEIINNIVRYSGGEAHISGNVGPSGSVNVRLTSNDSSMSGSGQLHGSTGHGRFHGRSSNGFCEGTWSASRG